MGSTIAETAATREGGVEARVDEPFLGWRRVVEWSLIPLAFVILRFVPARPTRLVEWLALLVAAVLFASPVIASSYREYVKGRAARSAEDLAVEYRVRLGLTLSEAVIPIGDLLGRIALAEEEERRGLQGQLRQRVVDAATGLAGADRTRAVFFALEGRTLRAAAWSGRPELPREAIARSGRGGELAYGLVERHDRILVPDVTDPHSVDVGLGGTYFSYLSVAVYAGTRNLGMMSVDAPEPEALQESDVDVAAALAQILGPGLAMK